MQEALIFNFAQIILIKMVVPLGAYLEIPQIAGKIIIPNNQPSFHVGKKEFEFCATKPLPDPTGLSAISSVRKDNTGNATSEHFIIYNKNGMYSVQDLHSTNGSYLGSIDLKKGGPYPIKDGEMIVLPIKEHGALVQLKIYFRIAKTQDELVDSSQPQGQPQYGAPQFQAPPAASKPIAAVSAPPASQDQPVYADPIARGPGLYAGNVVSQPGGQIGNAVLDVDGEEGSSSFISVHQMPTIPANAFAVNSGVDLSFVYRLDKSEIYHILIAFSLLFTMVYHTYINVMLIYLFIAYITDTMLPTASAIFIEPLPLALIFGLSFLVHELSHLQTGKHFGFQSRFCLTNVGVKSTLKAAIIGLPFGLPGAAVSVGVDPMRDVDKMGYIKFAGPFSNFILGMVLVFVSFFVPLDFFMLKMALVQGGTLNFVLGAFNMIPKEVKGFALDGKFIIQWKRTLYLTLLFAFVLGFLIANTLTNTYSAMLFGG